jgi:hypothetical protein
MSASTRAIWAASSERAHMVWISTSLKDGRVKDMVRCNIKSRVIVF